jgi:hypothetical protein
MMTQAKTTVATTFQAGTRYGLGLMERTFLTHKAYGHGGDSGYSGSAWYFPSKDMSIVVLNNDARKNSWQIVPVVQALLKTYLDCEATLSVPVVEHTFQINTSPNPFYDEINLQCELPTAASSLEWVLSNQLGVRVLNGEIPVLADHIVQGKLQGLDTLSPGLYFLDCFMDGKRVGTQKMIKSKG